MEQCLHIPYWKLCAQNSIASQAVESSQNKDIFWHASFQKVYLLCTLTKVVLWGSSPAKWRWEPRKKKKRNLGNDGPHPGCVTLEWHLSNRMSHYRVTVSYPAEYPVQIRMQSQALWEECALCAKDSITEKLECLRMWRTYIL